MALVRQVPLGLAVLRATPLLERPAPLRRQLAAQPEHPHPVAQAKPVTEVLRRGYGVDHPAHDRVLEALRDQVPRRLQAPGGVRRDVEEGGHHLLPHLVVAVEDGAAGGLQVGLRRPELRLEGLESPPGEPPEGGRLQDGLHQAEAVAVAVQRGVGPGRGAQQGQAVAVGEQAAAGRAEGDVAAVGEGQAQGLPVQAPVEETEAGGVDVDQHPVLVQGGEVERQALHLGRHHPGPQGGAPGAGVGPRPGRGSGVPGDRGGGIGHGGRGHVEHG